MGSHDGTHAELARTVDELVQWLGVVEAGLTAVLDKTLEVSEDKELPGTLDLNSFASDAKDSFAMLEEGEDDDVHGDSFEDGAASFTSFLRAVNREMEGEDMVGSFGGDTASEDHMFRSNRVLTESEAMPPDD